ncbi:MAG: glycosyltransferase family 39 protein, partial [Geminicoccaceae bacterium]|nr:glycosyltransferase family 39 protein [Geminicoccaceae bacterium]
MPARAAGSDARPSFRVPALLLLVVLAARLPSLFPSVIDWDESTFILIGQSWADGHLPFTELWDLKGPLAFAPFALAIELFGRSIVGVRLVGALIVLLTAYTVYHLFLRLFGAAGSLAGAVFTTLAISAAPAGGAVMSETVAILPLTLAALAISEGERRPLAGAAAGFAVSLATLVRPNLGLCALALGLFGLLAGRRRSLGQRAAWAIAYGLGGTLPVLILALLYAWDGHLPLLTQSVFGPALAYATTNLAASEVGSTLATGVLERLTTLRNLPYQVVGGALALAFGRLAHCWRRLDDRQQELVLLNATLSLTVMVSILVGGQAWLHYLIQLLPFACPLIGIMLAPALTPLPHRPRLAAFATALVLLAASVPSAAGYLELAQKLRAHGTPFADPGYQTTNFLGQRLAPDDRVLFLSHHIAGWLLGRRPIDRIVHPSNLARDEHVPVPGKLLSILESRPRFVVVSERRR